MNGCFKENFYRKNGFEKIGNHDFQIGKENFEFVAMKKDLIEHFSDFIKN